MRFVGPLGQVAIISESVLLHFLSNRQGLLGREAGGQLFGIFEGDNTVRVLKATGPRVTDIRKRFFYKPDKLNEQKEIDEEFVFGLHYVGDWHTHPQQIPSPSPYDIDSLQNVFRESSHSLAYLLLLVVGRALPPNGMYLGLVNSSEVYDMQSIEVSQRGERGRILNLEFP